MPGVDCAASGTATAKITTVEKSTGNYVESITTCQGSFVKKNSNLTGFVENRIDPSADRNKFEKSEYLFQSYGSADFQGVKVTKAVISYQEISKRRFGNEKQETKTFTVENPLVIAFDGHFFLCCDSLNTSNFLEKNAKVIRINQDLDLSKSFNGLGMNPDNTYLKLITFNIRSQNNIYKIDEYNKETVLDKLNKAGPLVLDDKKTIVGCYRIKDKCTIEIKMFGKIQGAPQIDTSPQRHPKSNGVPAYTSVFNPLEGDPPSKGKDPICSILLRSHVQHVLDCLEHYIWFVYIERLANCLNAPTSLIEKMHEDLDEPAINWETPGRFQPDELKQLKDNPAKRLFDYAYKKLDRKQLTVRQFKLLSALIDGPSIMDFQNPEEDFRSIKDVIPLDSEKMWTLCLQLNEEVDGEPKWKRLARFWGISADKISSQFAEPNQKKSPLEILLKDWLIVERPDFTVNELCSILGKIGCKEGKECLEGKLQEWCTKPM